MNGQDSVKTAGPGEDSSARTSAPLCVSISGIDVVVYTLLLGVGVLQFVFALRSDEIVWGLGYFELARSIIENGFYGINSLPQTMRPPGFPLIVAALCKTVSCTPVALIRSTSVFSTLAFLVSYALFRRLQSRTCAAVLCLLLATSPIFFALATKSLFSELPYLFFSMITLLLAVRMDDTKDSRPGLGMSLLCGFSLVMSLLIRSAGIALLSGVVAWLFASFGLNRAIAARRLKTFVPVLVLGLVVQAAWMEWAAKHEVLEWPMLEGYPKSYFAQLKVKNGNYPELGTASLGDMPARVVRNVNEHAVTVAKLLTRKDFINDAWFSPLILGPVVFVLIGITTSIWPSGGGIAEWYFISYESLHLLWPWFGDIRFFLPVAPLACFYLWRGGDALVRLTSEKPRLVGAFIFPLSILVGTFAAIAGWRSGHLQPLVAALFWAVLTAVSAWLVWRPLRKPLEALGLLISRMRIVAPGKKQRETMLRTAGAVLTLTLILVGLAQEVADGRSNLSFDITKLLAYGDVAAAKWIGANTAAEAVVMARDPGVVYHYSRRKAVWFPPSSDPQILIEGIRRHHVQFILIGERRVNYWLPPESNCFDSVRRSYPGAFQLVHDEPRFKVFRVVSAYGSAHS